MEQLRFDEPPPAEVAADLVVLTITEAAHWDNWRHRSFDPAARRAGLGRRRPYDLRHALASLLIREQKTSVVELADQLGHAPTMTLDTYTHVFREHRRSEPVDVNDWIREARVTATAPRRLR